MDEMNWAAVMVGVGLIALLVGEARERAILKWLGKPLASTGFVAAGFITDPWASAAIYGAVIIAGLCLSWFGDMFLLSKKRGFFLAGLFSFLLAHVAYAYALSTLGLDLTYTAGAVAGLAVLSGFVLRELWPHIEGAMRIPVVLYVVVITVMVAFAVGTMGVRPLRILPLAAFSFYLSDVAVALDRFVKPGFHNKAWGLPLYYISQLLFAHSILYNA